MAGGPGRGFMGPMMGGRGVAEKPKDFKGTLRKAAEMGYKGVGYGSMGGMEPGEFRAFLSECPMSVL